MKSAFVVLFLPFALGGCPAAATFGSALPGQIGPVVMGIDDSLYAIAIAKYKSAQMFKAEIDGTIQLPPLPPPVVTPPPVPPPVVTPPPVVPQPGQPLPPRPPGSPPPVVGNPAVHRSSNIPPSMQPPAIGSPHEFTYNADRLLANLGGSLNAAP